MSNIDVFSPPTEPATPPSVPPEETLGGDDRRQRRRVWLGSLTSRLVVGVGVLVFLLVCAIGMITYVALRSSLSSRLDQQVTSTANRNANYFSHCRSTGQPGAYACPSLTGPTQSTHEWIALLDVQGADVAHVRPGGPIAQLSLSDSARHRLVSDPGSVITAQQDGHTLRITAAQPGGSPLVVVTGLATDDNDETLHVLLAREILIGSAAIVVALLATLYGVRFSLRRLRRVTVTAQDVAAELSPEGAGLDRRVPEDDSGTEVGQLATSFNTMLAAVETQFAARVESEQRMRQFLADASHELRTPLTSIRGYAELARMQRASGAEQIEDNLDRIESEGTRMSRLVEDLLMLARRDAEAADDATRIEHEPVDVPSLLDDVVAGAHAAYPDRPIELQVGPLPAILGDRDHLLRAVRNLVNNAAVHTAAGRPIRVAGNAEPGAVVITVADGGPGLPPEDAAHVFERFWRADKARTRARGGSGLGMSIVAAIVRAHGGTVGFDSSVEHGSTATIRLPLAETPQLPLNG